MLCDLKPGGKYVAKDLYEAGGIELVAKRLLDAGLLHEDAITVTGRTIGDHAGDAVETDGPEGRAPARRPDQGHRRPGHPARQPRARRLRREALRPRAPPATRARRASSRARRPRWPPSSPARSSRATSSSSATRARPAGPACARCSPSPPRSTARAWASTSRCSPTGASAARRTASWPATSRPSPSAAARSPPSQDGDEITIDVDNRRLDVALDDETIAARVAAYDGNDNADLGGVLGKYAKLVSSASIGAIT